MGYTIQPLTLGRRLPIFALFSFAIWLWVYPSISRGSVRPGPSLRRGFTVTDNFKYCGFTGDGPDFFVTAVSQDSVHWTHSGGEWNVITGNINAPTCANIQGNWYVHAAADHDNDITLRHWYVGILDQENTVRTIAIVDWSNKIPGVKTCFSGEWFVDSIPHLTIPCTTDRSLLSGWRTYETHPLDATLSTWSDPVDIGVSGSSMYDSSVIKLSDSSYLLLVSEFIPDGQRIELEWSSSLYGPYKQLTNGDWAGLFAKLGPHEGPWMFRTRDSRWRLMLEALQSHQMYFIDCLGSDPSHCEWTAPSPWAEDLQYRHGTVVGSY